MFGHYMTGDDVRPVRQWFRETTGGLPATFWYLWTGTLINRLGSFVLIFLAIYLTTERDFSEFHAGLVIGLWGAGGAAAALLGASQLENFFQQQGTTAEEAGAQAEQPEQPERDEGLVPDWVPGLGRF